jgi:hypothetical protein
MGSPVSFLTVRSGHASEIILFVTLYMLAYKRCIVELHEMHVRYYLLLHSFFLGHAEQKFADKICVELLQRYFGLHYNFTSG